MFSLLQLQLIYTTIYITALQLFYIAVHGHFYMLLNTETYIYMVIVISAKYTSIINKEKIKKSNRFEI